MLWWLPYIVLSCELPSQTGTGPDGGMTTGELAQRDATPGAGKPPNQITCDDLITTLNISKDHPIPRPPEDGEERKMQWKWSNGEKGIR